MVECITRSTPRVRGRCRKGVAHVLSQAVRAPAALAIAATALQVRDRNGGVRRRFSPDESRGGPKGRLDGREVRHVRERDLETPRDEMLAQQLCGPEVGVERRHDVITGRKRLKHGHCRSHAGAEGHGRSATLEARHGHFERLPIRVRITDVLVAGREGAVGRALKGSREVDCGHQGSRYWIGRRSRMHSQGLKAQFPSLLPLTRMIPRDRPSNTGDELAKPPIGSTPLCIPLFGRPVIPSPVLPPARSGDARSGG